MSKELIPPVEWSRFLDSFTRKHEGWLVTIDVLDPNVGTSREAEELPLLGITAEQRSVVLRLGTSATEHVSHVVSRPDAIWLTRTPEGADEELGISSEGTITTVGFRSPMPTEMVDDLPSTAW